jgi:hypothetical protein
MNEIFISYASDDRAQAQRLAGALTGHGWDVWWDREIPLGQSFDRMIESAIAQAKCVLVLWSNVSVNSEWVRNEATEGKRRGILVPVFIERIDAPLAFRLLNGADLSDWNGDANHGEFRRLVECIADLLGVSEPSAPLRPLDDRSPVRTNHREALRTGQFNARNLALVAGAVLLAGTVGYYLRSPEREPVPQAPLNSPPEPPANALNRVERRTGDADIDKRIHDLVGMLGGAVPATSLAKAFHVPDLGLRITFLSHEQSAATLGAMPPGAVVMEVESGRPMAKAGIHVGDVVLTIGGKKIQSDADLRHAIFSLGPGTTQYSYRRGDQIRNVAVDCPGCKAE